MPRYARLQSSSKVYHVMLRGINRAEIFIDDEDRCRFIDTLIRMKGNDEYELLAYCLMDNHVHLLIKEKEEPIKKIMKRIGVSYAHFFNKKYGRVGHVFQDRFRSEAVEDEPYLIWVARYIHNNPVKAGMVKEAEDYQWSSYQEYITKDTGGFVATEELLSLFSADRDKGIKLFKEHMMEDCDNLFMDIEEQGTAEQKQEAARQIIKDLLKKNKIDEAGLNNMKAKPERDRILRLIKEESSISVREISRIIGIGKDIISRA